MFMPSASPCQALPVTAAPVTMSIYTHSVAMPLRSFVAKGLDTIETDALFTIRGLVASAQRQVTRSTIG